MADKGEIILASGSRFRRQMLEQAGINFGVIAADVDEAGIKNALVDEDPDIEAVKVAERLAREKALQVSHQHPDAWVIGADQVLVCGGEIFSKPPTLAAAREHLIALRGLTHALPTAVALARGGTVEWSFASEPELTMRNFSDAFLDSYLAAEGRVLCDTVGAYQLEGRGAQLFEAIEGDGFTIVGLPLLPLLGALRDRGVLKS